MKESILSPKRLRKEPEYLKESYCQYKPLYLQALLQKNSEITTQEVVYIPANLAVIDQIIVNKKTSSEWIVKEVYHSDTSYSPPTDQQDADLFYSTFEGYYVDGVMYR